jgi:hypothetical protein
MSVTRSDNGTIVLAGSCGVEEAEPLLQMLVATPEASVDWGLCTHLHTAVIQVVLAAKPKLTGPCGDAWVEEWLVAGWSPAPPAGPAPS